MKFIDLPLPGLKLIEPDVFEDERGFFYESYHKEKFKEGGIDIDFVQDNHSKSAHRVLRGMHFQKEPYGQDKLVRVTQGEVYDAVIDVRKDSATFGQWYGLTLSAADKKMFFIPKGFAHGFVVISETAEFEYKVSQFYAKEYELGIIWNDPSLAISWPINNPLLGQKDREYPTFEEVKELL